MKVNPAEASFTLPYATRAPKVATETGVSEGQTGVSEGQAAVEMIENAQVSPPTPDEKGTRINTVA